MSKMFGRKLKVLRAERELSHRELARISGLSNTTICYLEAGMQEPTARTLKKLACGLEVPLEELVEAANSSNAVLN